MPKTMDHFTWSITNWGYNFNWSGDGAWLQSIYLMSNALILDGRILSNFWKDEFEFQCIEYNMAGGWRNISWGAWIRCNSHCGAETGYCWDFRVAQKVVHFFTLITWGSMKVIFKIPQFQGIISFIFSFIFCQCGSLILNDWSYVIGNDLFHVILRITSICQVYIFVVMRWYLT